MKKASPHLLLALCLALLGGCSATSDTGSAWFAVSVPQSLSSISRVTVTASAPDLPAVSLELVSSNGVWSGLLGNLPAGTHRVFLAQAFDASGTPRLQGQTSDVTISANQTTAVAIVLQELSPPPAYDNEAPLIDSLVASSTSVQPGGTLSLSATAHDPNPGDSLSFEWTSSSGTFSSPTAATTSWTAPSSTGIHTLTFTVRDSQGAAISASLAVNVVADASTGSAAIHLSFNFWPVVSKVSASLNRLDAGQATSLSVLASDADGDALAYQWAASCPGTWTDAASRTASFVPSSRPASACNNCRLTVTVQDGRGGQTTGALSLCVASPTAPERFPPAFTHASQSPSTPAPGQTVAFDVTASDPQASPMTFAWTANAGVLGTPVHGASTSHIPWTAPSCVPAGTTPSITATVTNAFNQTATRSFAVTGLPVCASSSGWTSTASMASARVGHTATLLSNGQVLVSGGYNSSGYLATAELYDAASGTWSTTGSMASARRHAAAVLLPNGQVLVSGGYNSGGMLETAEVYDPASGAWSATGSMASTRFLHRVTLLPSGHVLVSGGTNDQPLPAVSAEVYDPASGAWSATGAMVWPRYIHSATLLPGGKVLVVGGYDFNSYLAAAEVYDPASNTWSAVAPMSSPRWNHAAELLSNGKVLVAAGFFATAEVYDPAANTWSPTGAMAIARLQHTATLLPDGKVLVSGGSSGPAVPPTAELYDPASNTWSAAAPMIESRNQHTATWLPTGKLLVVGGGFASAELYTP